MRGVRSGRAYNGSRKDVAVTVRQSGFIVTNTLNTILAATFFSLSLRF